MEQRRFSLQRMGFFCIVFLALLGLFSISLPLNVQAGGSVRYAAPVAQGSGNCSSWANACTLQTALSQAVSGDEIWVKMGVHYPGPAGNRGVTFSLKNDVALYGGFAGTETSRDQRNWTTNKTILSGDIDKNDNHGGDYINEVASQIVGSNAYHVLTGDYGTDSTAILDGFTITAGQANGSGYNSFGGGMINQFSSPTLANLTFSGNAAASGGGMYNNFSHPSLNSVTLGGNSATADGGGMANYQSSPTLSNVTFNANSSPSGYGGGMSNDRNANPSLTQVTFSENTAKYGAGLSNRLSSPSLTQVTFSSNEAFDSGGGMFNQSSSPQLINVTFSNNTAPYDSGGGSGGGMVNEAGSSPQLINVTFSANYAYAFGGGMLNHSSSPQLTNVIFNSNGVEGCGGGMANRSGSSPQLINVVLRSNSGFTCGGGLFNDSSNPTLVNVTFNGNIVYNDSGGGIYNDNSSPTLTNVILWGNTAPSGAGIYNAGSSAPVISYSDIQGGYAGTGNINADPLFMDAANGNLRLQLTSPAIDAGNNAALPAGVTTDLDGNLRRVDIPTIPDSGSGTPPIVDMGAYEAQSSTYTLYTLTVSKSGTGGGTVTSNPAGIDCGADCLAAYIAYTPVTLSATPAADSSFAGWSGDCDENGQVTMTAAKACTAIFTQNPPSPAGVRYAAPSAAGSGDCSSWANACTLQTALSQAVSGDEIWVKMGVHYPGSNRTDTFTLKNGVALYGGFAGTETLLSQRDWSTNKTILSGDIDKNDNHGGDYINEAASQIMGSNAYQVVRAALIDSTTVLDGFVITAGQANGPGYDSFGGGMINQFSSPTLANLTFSGNAAASGGGMYNNFSHPSLNSVTLGGNSATADGGGMANYQSSPTLSNVTFNANSSPSGYGGGMSNDRNANPSLTQVTFSENTAKYGAGLSNRLSSPSLTQVTFSSNEAFDSGGGMFNQSSSPQLINVTFSNNTAPYDSGGGSGGGMVNEAGSSPQLINVTFSANYAYAFGGGMLNHSSSPQLTNVIFNSNGVEGCGGGMANRSGSSPQLINVVLRSNSGFTCGGGLFNDSSNPTLVNVTFNGNIVYNDSGGGIYNDNSNPTLTNVILWGNTAPSGAGIYNAGSSVPVISYSDIQGCGGSGSGWVSTCGSDGSGNIEADPRFGNNLRLQPTSPAIDAGNNAAVPAGVTTDLDGVPRFLDVPAIPDSGSGTAPIVDMGAYEAFPVLYATPSAQGSGVCYAWAHACTLQTALSRAVTGQEIWVKAGVHYPGINRTDTFTLKNGVAVYGGFAGSETSRDQRDWQTNQTILSGDIDANDTNTDGNFIAETTADIQGNNAYHVVTGSETDNTAVLNGFVITAGQANGSNPHQRGGGMYNDSGSPMLTDLIFSGNLAQDGGGMHNRSSSPTLTDVTFSGNFSNGNGGGMHNNDNSSPTLTHVTFSGNLAKYGGGMYNNDSSSPTLTDVTFTVNSARWGSGMANFYSNPTLTDVIFSGNSAQITGGGMFNIHSSPTLTDVIFSGNSAGWYGGGGIYNEYSSPTLTNVVFSGNSAKTGGGMSNYDSNPTLTNVTFSSNTSRDTRFGSAIDNFWNCNPTLKNVILWGGSNPRISYYQSTATISYSNIQDCGGSGSGWNTACGTDGGGNIDADPLFVDADGPDNVVGTADDNLRLGFGSPVIDAGNNISVTVTTDLDGLPRKADGNGDGNDVVDMGAYEAGQMICGVAANTAYTFDKNSGVVITTTDTLGNLSCLYVDEMGLNHPNATAGIQSGRYWLIRGLQGDKQTDASGFNVSLTLPTTFTPDANDKLCRYPGNLGGSGWDCAANSYTANTITRNGVSAFSDWAVGNNVGPTAVGLTSFQASSSTSLIVWLLPAALAIAMFFTKKRLAKP